MTAVQKRRSTEGTFLTNSGSCCQDVSFFFLDHNQVFRRTIRMPVGPLIYATTQDEITSAELARLCAEIIGEMGVERCAFEIESHENYCFLPDALPKTKTVVRARPTTPYYGPNYARGNWPEIAAIIEFMGHRIRNADVWYGQDSSDEIELVTSEWLASMWQYWADKGTREYYKRGLRGE